MKNNIETALYSLYGADGQKETKYKEGSAWKEETEKGINNKATGIIKGIISTVLSRDEFHAVLVSGKGGLGKTYSVLTAIKELLKPSDWKYLNGHITALSLYSFLFENRNRKLIVLDDIDYLLTNPTIISLLKACIWDVGKKRIIQYNTSANYLGDLPSLFSISAKIIIICNKIPKQNDINIKALVDRTLHYQLSYSYAEITQIMEKMINSEAELTANQKEKVKKLLISDSNSAKYTFSFRALKKAITFVKSSKNYAELFQSTTQTDKNKLAYIESVKRYSQPKDQIRYFCDKTGYSRRTFYNIRRDLE